MASVGVMVHDVLDMLREPDLSEVEVALEALVIIWVDHRHVELAELGHGACIREGALVTNLIMNQWLRVQQL